MYQTIVERKRYIILGENVTTCLITAYSHFITFTTIQKTVFGCCEGGYIYLILQCACEQNGSKITTNVQQMFPQWNTDLIDIMTLMLMLSEKPEGYHCPWDCMLSAMLEISFCAFFAFNRQCSAEADGKQCSKRSPARTEPATLRLCATTRLPRQCFSND